MAERIGSTTELYRKKWSSKKNEHEHFTSSSRYPTGHGMRLIRGHALAHWLQGPLISIASMQM